MKSLAAVVVTALAFSVAQGVARAGSFTAPLLQCNAVTIPATVPGCVKSANQDTLQWGHATVDDAGGLTVTMASGPHNTTFAVSFVSVDGSQTVSVPVNLVTDPKGNGVLRDDHWEKPGTVGAGNFVLTQTSPAVTGTQFVTGVIVSPTGGPPPTREDYRVSLVECSAIDIFSTPSPPHSSCGTDTLTNGYVWADYFSGDLEIRINGAKPSTVYNAILVTQTTTTPTPTTTIGNLPETDAHGNAALIKPGFFAAGANASGTVEIFNSSTLEFLSGFNVTEQFQIPITAKENLVPCGQVSNPVSGALPSCGSDQLDAGSYSVSANGKVTVTLTGASPSTNYELWFRPLDGSNSSTNPDQDTGLELSTNTSGNVSSASVYFPSDTVWSGTFVVKEKSPSPSAGLDQFVVGFPVQ